MLDIVECVWIEVPHQVAEVSVDGDAEEDLVLEVGHISGATDGGELGDHVIEIDAAADMEFLVIASLVQVLVVSIVQLYLATVAAQETHLRLHFF
ncbi:hypothetical protein HN51_027253 [Arachis hypogaea]